MKIELTSMDSHKKKIVVDQFPVIVGLDPGADICLDDSAVGHYQCMIDDGDDGLTVWDLGTQTGTFINGQRVNKKTALMPGDELSIARCRYKVDFELPSQKPKRQPQPRQSKPRHCEPAIS